MSIFKEKTFMKNIIPLAIPIALQNLVTAVLNIIDQTMVGWLPADIAEYCLSAVLLANQVVFIIQMLHNSVGNTANMYIAQYTHNGNEKMIPRRVGLALSLNIGIGIFATLFCGLMATNVIGLYSPSAEYAQYASDFLQVVALSFIPMSVTMTFSFVLRAIKKLNVPLYASIFGVICNMIFNYVFMFGAFGIEAMGIMGAAWGTVIARTLEMIVVVIALIKFKYPIFTKPSVMFKSDRAFNKKFFATFFPVLSNEFFWVLSMTVYLFVYDKLDSSEVMLSAYNIAQSVDKLISVFMIGVGCAGGILITNVVAKGNRQDIAKQRRLTLQFGAIMGAFVAVVTFATSFFAPEIFINVSDEARDVATKLLWCYAGSAMLRTLNFMLIVGVLRSGGDAKFCLISETIAIWCVSVPLVIVGGIVFHFNIFILYGLSMVAEVIKFIVCLKRARSERWIKF
ncbi:MAG: MATE family efflux transporter [Bacillota bacterium]